MRLPLPLRSWLVGLAVIATSVACTGTPPASTRPDHAPAAGSALAEDRLVLLPGPIGERTTTVFHPASAGPNAPLVIALHGADDSGSGIREKTGLDRLARREGFVVAYPDAIDGRWNAGLCCRQERRMVAVDDVEFLHELRQQLMVSDQIDPNRVFAMGMSNGGMLAYAWACDRPGDVAAIGVVAAVLATGCTRLSPVTVIAVHGSEDGILPLRGGGVVRGSRIPSVDESLVPFRTAATCPPNPITEQIGPASVATWRCTQGRAIVRAIIAGGGHTWPAGVRVVKKDGTDPRGATDFIWHRMSVPS